MTKALRFVVTVFALIGALTPIAAAATCGDDVGGVRLPCACGDVVVSDTRLQASDPVVANRCATDGLIVRARSGAGSITLDLAGLSIIGSGLGTGIRVVDGGTEGAMISGGSGSAGGVVGFGTGFRARGQRSVRELRNVNFTGNARDGVVLRGAGTRVDTVTAERNGRDGLRVGGRDLQVHGSASQMNGGDGVQASGRGVRLENSVTGNNLGTQLRARGLEGRGQ